MTDARGRGQLHVSEELRSITARYWAAFQGGDTEKMQARFSMMRGISLFGTDESEYIDDPDALVSYTRLEFDQPEPWFGKVGAAEIDAWVEGEVGWAVVRSTVESTPVRALRVSFIFHLEHDEWKIVHQHFSVGVPNEEVFGIPLTFSLERLVEAVESDRPDVTPWAAADGTVTIAFTDIEGSTALNTSFGDRGWIEVLRAHNEIVARWTTEHGGTVVQRIGDGFMLAFPAARRALRCAVAIEQEIAATFNDPGSPIKVRIGVHTGEVIQQADEFFGQAVNYAARVAGAAAGGEILSSNLVHDLVSSDREFRFGVPREVELKGIDGPQRLYPLTLEGRR